MKSKFLKFTLIIGAFMSVFSLFGCLNKNKNEKTEQIVFFDFSQEEKQEYVKNYLSSNYNIECDLVEVEKRPINMVSTEDDYYTIATVDDHFWFAVWITPQAEIKDTAFTYEIKDKVNEFFAEKLKEVGINCVVYDRFIFQEYPNRKWTSDEIHEMMTREKVTNSIHVFTSEENVEEELVKAALSEYKGIVYIHYCEYDDNFSLEQYDSYVYLS